MSPVITIVFLVATVALAVAIVVLWRSTPDEPAQSANEDGEGEGKDAFP